MRSTRNPHRPGARSLTALLLICLGLLAASAGSAQSQPLPPPPEHPDFWLFPELTQTPDGVYNRLQGHLRARFDHLRNLAMRVDQQSEELRALQSQGRGPHIGTRGLMDLRDQLGALHESVDALVEEAERTREYLRAEVVPQLPTMIAEIDRELQSLPPEDPGRNRLAFLRGALERFAENPEEVLARFEHGAQVGAWPEDPRSFDRRPDEGHQGSWRLTRRLERIEAQQQSLREQLEANDREIQRIRAIVERAESGQDREFDRQSRADSRSRNQAPETQPSGRP